MLEPTAVLLARADGSPAPTSFSTSPLTSDDPFAAGRQVACAGVDEIAAGTVRLSGQFDVDEYPYTEMIVIHAGLLTLQSPDQKLQLAPGDSAVIARGTSLRIEAQENSFWAYCADTQAIEARNPGLTALEPLTLLAPSAAPDAEILISPAPQCRSHNQFVEEATNLRIGVWDSTPYTRRARPHKLHELMHLIEGSVTLQTADGSDLTVNTGDTVYVPKDAPCAWKSDGYVRKFYVCK